VDGRAIGSGPAAIDLDPGAHRLAATLPGYLAREEPFTLAPSDEPSRLVVTLEPQPATLRVHTKPPGANVLLDGVKVGVTPYAGTIAPGPHRVATGLVGRELREASFVAEPGGEVVREFELPWEPESLSVETTPRGAAISVDGAAAGNSPLTLPLAPGKHTVEAALPGHRVEVRSHVARAGRNASLKIALSPAPGKLSIATRPAGAAVVIDGKKAGASPLSVAASPGPHQVSAQLRGYQPKTARVQVPPGEEARHEFELEPVPVPVQFFTSPPGAAVRVDGQPAGRSPVAPSA
jgi:hypothetical protein